jgi:TolB-like protein
MIVFLLIMVTSVAQADFKKTKIAVLDFNLQGNDFETKDMGKIVAEWFITALVKEGRFEVIERGMLKKILEEQKLGLSGIVDANTATELGKILGVKIVITGTVMKFKGITEINARIIDVQSASIITAENVRSTSTASLQQLVVQMSEKIIKNFPLEGYIVQRNGKKITIDLGNRAGVHKDMEFLVYKEGNVIKHPKTGEVLDVEQIETGKVKIVSVRGKISEGEIVDEKGKNVIRYGQFVKSIRGPLKPAVVYREPAVVHAAPVLKSVRASAPSSKQRAQGPAATYIKQIKSENAISQRDAAKRIIRAQLFDASVLDVVEKYLLKGFNANPRDRNQIDAMAWMCKALGASGKSKYTKTLTKVSKDAESRKLRGYAAKSLAQL